MNIWVYLIVFGILAWTSLYSFSYATWVWKNKNKLGAFAVCGLVLLTIALPIYSLFFKG